MLICHWPHELALKGTQAISLFRAKRVACVRAGHPLAGNVMLRDLAKYPLICPREKMGFNFGFRQIFSSVGLELPEALVSNSVHIANEIVLNSNAFALFSDLSIINERQLGRLHVAELAISTQY